MSVTSYSQPSNPETASRELARADALPVAGGTDLVPLLRDGIVTPGSLVDLRRLPGLAEITVDASGALRIGAAVTLDQLCRDARIATLVPALGEAAHSVGSYALRVAGTLGGNLVQHVRCWYYRGGHDCLRRGGSLCSAEIGENQYHAIFRDGGCVVSHPSDCAVVLVALEAAIQLRSVNGTRSVAASEFLVPSRVRLDQTTCLEPGEFIEAISIPGEACGGVQFYLKQMQRSSWDFALVSLAATRRQQGAVRLVLGGVANTPWRVNTSIEEDVASGGLSTDDIDTLAERALYDATPLSKNAWKVDVAAALLRRAIAQLAQR
jgi:xanthine dehydrogenase YagS FAD-binding subunit